MLMASDKAGYLFSVILRRFGCAPHGEATWIARIPVAGRPLMAVKTDHPTPSVAFVVCNDCQVVSSLCGRLKHVSNCGLGMPPLAHHVGTLQQAVEDVQQP
jgi:hypothetical protein